MDGSCCCCRQTFLTAVSPLLPPEAAKEATAEGERAKVGRWESAWLPASLPLSFQTLLLSSSLAPSLCIVTSPVRLFSTSRRNFETGWKRIFSSGRNCAIQLPATCSWLHDEIAQSPLAAGWLLGRSFTSGIFCVAVWRICG